jgi:hypothetical protein
MFEELIDKQNKVIPISKKQSEITDILAGGYGLQTKQLLQFCLSDAIATAVDEAKCKVVARAFSRSDAFDHQANMTSSLEKGTEY